MANFSGDISPHIVTPTLFGTTTAVTTDANATGASVDLADNVGNIVSAVLVVGDKNTRVFAETHWHTLARVANLSRLEEGETQNSAEIEGTAFTFDVRRT